MWYIFLIIGYLCLFIPPIIPSSQGKKLNKEQFTLQVGVPVMIGLVLVGLAYYNLLMPSYDEKVMAIIIAVTASGGIFISLLAVLLSGIYIRWRAS